MSSLHSIYAHNIDLISRYPEYSPDAFSVNNEGYITKRTGFGALAHSLFSGKEHKKKLNKAINKSIRALNQATRASFVNKQNEYTNFFFSAQRYNSSLQRLNRSLFARLSCDEKSLIYPNGCPELALVTVNTSQIVQAKMRDIAASQDPHTEPTRLNKKKTLYYYNENSLKENHIMEAARIFISTQTERLLSLIGRIIETISSVFCTVTMFKKYHYFKNDEDKMGKIYAKDSPVAADLSPTSYWIGHATCLLHVQVKSSDGKASIPVNIITDPVMGDLNKLFYPRMTKPGRNVEELPPVQICLISHNHYDHMDVETLDKLHALNKELIFIVPEGDGPVFKARGFTNVYENNWWTTTTIPVQQDDKKGDLRITAVPGNHWSGRSPMEGHHSAFVGYVIDDTYFAGDTARLSEEHIETLRTKFNIRTTFQPGGPDESRKDMRSTHQASVDGLWMHFNLILKGLYERMDAVNKPKADFIKAAKETRTIFMHTKTYKLGNLHFDDTESSIKRVEKALQNKTTPKDLKDYERDVYNELIQIGETLKFTNDEHLTKADILEILKPSIIVPKIGSRTELKSSE